jgi:putative BNR repeat neuraminidase/concanavalin A-like lectin/glucanase superfamily protein/PKD domain-containing protein
MKPLRGACVALLCVFAWATPAEAQQTPLGGGAWSWFGDPRAVHHDGKTFVGWVDLEGDIKVMSYDHQTEERVTAVLQARLNQDDHANPSIHVLETGQLMVFYSRHVGPAMHYRISEHPGDVRSWEPPQTVPTNVAGNRGYTYPNPVHLAAENRTYLFWRGGNYNPTYSTQDDGSTGWSPARNLIHMPGERPYVKYASSGGHTIHVAYTNAHPNEYADVNIYYARVRAGRIERANGALIKTLPDAPITPGQGDTVFPGADQAWVHDVAADSMGRPVIVFASFPSEDAHRYHYARWTGTTWQVEDIVLDAGGSFREERRPLDYYSGGLTLDHEDPSRVYLSRQDSFDNWHVEQWTRSPSGTWSSVGLSLPDAEPNVRPVSPRGPFDDDDLNVIWMGGPYPNYEEYETQITSRWLGVDQPPVADAEPSVRSGPVPLPVHFSSRAEDDDPLQWEWDFGDGSPPSHVPDASHEYEAPGRYFAKMTVTDNMNAPSTFVEEIVVGLPAAPVTHTGGAAGSTVHGAVDPENRQTQWYFEYGPTNRYGAVTPAGMLPGNDSLHQVSTALPGVVAGRLYHYRLIATNASGTTEGEDRVMVAGSTPGSDAYRDAVLDTGGLAAYWRLGELSGSASANELGGGSGTFAGRFVLGQVGVLGALGDTAASFDGLTGERSGPGPALSVNGTMEGWFRWRTGTAVMRDHTGPNGGWLLTFNSGGTLRYRVGGHGYDTGVPIQDVRDGTWHHLVATKQGAAARLYVDGVRVHSGSNGDPPDQAEGPWHVMRNGSNSVFSAGEADEIALYTRALNEDEVRRHYDTARAVAATPLPPETPDPVVEPPAAGTGLGGGVLTPAVPATRPTGVAFVRAGRLIARGARDTRNRLTARRRGRAWQVADAAAPLRAGRGCRRLGPRKVSCRAAGVKRIELHGGAGADTLAVRGRIRALLVGGPGADRLSGGRLTRFVGGAGADRSFRRP